MCGIAGIVLQNKLENGLVTLKKMSDAIAHRGPDGEGQWLDASGNVGLAHRRLSIIETSDIGAQPMHYQSRYTITFNGEIYNYLELRQDLVEQGQQFHTNTDTEVLLALYAHYGTACLARIDGMFAFAIYDQVTEQLFCARDRFGEKPLYYSHKNGQFIFGSEMKALWASGVEKSPNRTMEYNYLAYGFMCNPSDLSVTFFNNINSLPHAHYLLLDIKSNTYSIEQYYQISNNAFSGNAYEVNEQLSHLLKQSISRRLRSDVAVGCSLSGGLDSSLIATLVQSSIGSNELKTFSAVFPGFAKDESPFIQKTVEKVGVSSFTTTPHLADFEAQKKQFLSNQEEPVIDESPYILYKVYELAKQHGIKVLLDGQGADEVFAGYHAYYFTFLKEMRSLNQTIYKKELKVFNELAKAGIINDYKFFRRQNMLSLLFGEKLSDIRIWKQKLDQFRHAKIDKTLYQAEHSHSFPRKYVFNTLHEHLSHDCSAGKLQTLLRYADRSSMAHGVEIRLPYLNHDLVDFIFSLPAHYKIKEGWTKWILRDTFSEQLPEQVAWRRDKVGAEGELK